METGSPRERYQAALRAHGYHADPAQERAVTHLERVYKDLLADASPGMFTRISALLTGQPPERKPVRGLYLWGGVGRGKTFLMDLFFHALPFERKMRLHFHRFMQQVHAELKTLRDREDPLHVVATRLTRRARVICFDEFFVSDIADAMLLGRLFEYLFGYGVTLVATSNIPPENLYAGGLQRARFLPAIHAIQKHCEILNVDAGIDYRLRTLERAEIYHYPLDASAEAAMERYFNELSADGNDAAASLFVHGRPIAARRLGEGAAWFDFSQLCEGPRSAADYIEIAREYHSVLLSNVPVLDWTRENDARRFVTLVDEFYDRQVKLIISAAAPASALYKGEKLAFEFERTLSRLREMASHDYLALPHRP